MTSGNPLSFQDGIKNILTTVSTIGPFDIIDIFLVAIMIYLFIKIVRDTRANQLIKGIFLFLGVYIVIKVLPLKSMNFLMEGILQFGATALIVVFQPELRRALERVGRTRLPMMSLFGSSLDEKRLAAIHGMIGEFRGALRSLSRTRTGALVVFEKQTRLGDIVKTGTVIDSAPSEQMICGVFFPNSPLHDGAMIVRDARLWAAGCFLPLTENNDLSKELGTRHRAAIGMSENSDAIVLVVSEETGNISIAQNGILTRNFTPETVADFLRVELLADEENETGRSGGKLRFWRTKK